MHIMATTDGRTDRRTNGRTDGQTGYIESAGYELHRHRRQEKDTGEENRGTLAAAPADFWALMCCRAGRPKARVLPDPVAATPTRSCPDRMMGQHCA